MIFLNKCDFFNQLNVMQIKKKNARLVMGNFLSAFFFSLSVKLLCFAFLKEVEKKKHKEGLLFFLISSEIHCNLFITKK